MGQGVHFETRFIEYAVDNLRVKQHGKAKVTSANVS
jgi:hypothetical protein